MDVAALPNQEFERLEALAQYGLSSASDDPLLQGIVDLAARLCDAPIALASILQADRQCFIARTGLRHLRETARDVSICAHAILGDELMEVPDTHLDARFRDNPLVTSDPKIRFYAGKPLITRDGLRLGTLCVCDRRPRRLSDSQRDGLHTLAALATSLLEKRLAERRLEASEARYESAIRDASMGTLNGDGAARKKVETALRASEAHLARAQRIAGIGSAEIYFDDDRWIWSDELFRICGLDRTVVSPSWDLLMTIVHEADRDRVRSGFDAARRGVTPEPIDYRIIRPDGSLRVLRREAELIRDDRGAVIGMISTKRDVTDMREAERQKAELERQVVRMQRIEALGTLAGGVAHDINNLLLPIFAMTDELLRSAAEGSREREYISLIRQAGTRARDLVRRLLTFARCDEPRVEPIDLAKFVADALPLLRSSLPGTIALRPKVEPVPSILADEGQLHQVLLNLVTNSAQAIGAAGGEITIEVRPTTNGAGPSHPSGVRLAVVDDGCGMDGESQRRAFEPFFTTKSVENGTGLGLSVVQGIVANHGGSIALKSEAGRGTRIDIDFPAV